MNKFCITVPSNWEFLVGSSNILSCVIAAISCNISYYTIREAGDKNSISQSQIIVNVDNVDHDADTVVKIIDRTEKTVIRMDVQIPDYGKHVSTEIGHRPELNEQGWSGKNDSSKFLDDMEIQSIITNRDNFIKNHIRDFSSNQIKNQISNK